jgi:cytochrome c553
MRIILFAVLSFFLVAAANAAGDAARGKQKAEQVCGACHGVEGNKPSAPDQPVLAGQYYDYLVQVLGDYKSGRRSNPIMKAFAGQLSKQDMEDVAAWFSGQSRTSLYDER